jgi:serine acetyltransferase
MADARFYHGLERAGKHDGSFRLLLTIFGNRGLWLLTFYRLAHFCLSRRDYRSPLWWLARLLAMAGRPFALVCCRSEVRSDCEIPGDVYLSNKGYLICGPLRIGQGTIIHDHCTFGQAVVARAEGRPVIGSDVWIGPDCIIAGPVAIGDGAAVLPHSFVTFDVPARALVKGNPARIIRRDFDNSVLRTGLEIFEDVTDVRA